VTAPILEMIMLAPAGPSVAAGQSIQFMAMGMYSDNSMQDFTSQVTWGSDAASVATISNAQQSKGLATGVAVGTSVIKATLDGMTGSTVLTVSPAVLVSIAVAHNDSSIVSGATEQFTATGSYSDRSTLDLTQQVTWVSAVPSVVSINAAGLATGVASGASDITASYHGLTGSTSLTVTARILQLPPLVFVTDVNAVFNKRHLVTSILVTFSGSVNASEAQGTGIYRLATPGKHGSFTAKNSRAIKLRTAFLDSAHNTVRLTPKKPFSLGKPVQLRIDGSAPTGLMDSLGRFIDGDQDGIQGGNVVAVIRRNGVALSTATLARSLRDSKR
jgi:hypothetical protein